MTVSTRPNMMEYAAAPPMSTNDPAQRAPTPLPVANTGPGPRGGLPQPGTQPPIGTTPAPASHPTPIPPGTTPYPTASPIQMMDWQQGLRQGDEQAVTRQVDPNELVQNQLNGITAQGSQYLTQAADRAREEASNRGMMFSTMAAGAGSRAAIDAALPIAQQDAAQYGHVYDANMAAQNTDNLADQQMYGQMLGQAVGIRANLDESERNRGFTADQNQQQRSWQTGERIGGQQFQTGERIGTEQWQGQQNTQQQQWQTGERVGAQNFQAVQQLKQNQWQTSERVGTQGFQAQQQQMQNSWQGAQNNAQRQQELQVQELQIAHDTAMRKLDETFQGSQLDKQMAEQRFQDFTNAMGAQTQELSNTITSIYNNPNLSAEQQSAAVANARATYQSLFNSYAASLSGGVPPIFWQPYAMNTKAPATGGGGGMQTGGNLPPTQVPGGGGGGGGGGNLISYNPNFNGGYGGPGYGSNTR